MNKQKLNSKTKLSELDMFMINLFNLDPFRIALRNMIDEEDDKGNKEGSALLLNVRAVYYSCVDGI